MKFFTVMILALAFFNASCENNEEDLFSQYEAEFGVELGDELSDPEKELFYTVHQAPETVGQWPLQFVNVEPIPPEGLKKLLPAYTFPSFHLKPGDKVRLSFLTQKMPGSKWRFHFVIAEPVKK